MTVTVALAGDTMLGRGVARTLATTPSEALVAPELLAVLGQADLVVLHLECCISERGRPWPAPGKPFFFRAPPRAGRVVGVTDHPPDFAAGLGRPGVAFADLGRRVPGWLAELVHDAGAQADVTLVTPHRGPNMNAAPVRHVRRAAAALVEAGRRWSPATPPTCPQGRRPGPVRPGRLPGRLPGRPAAAQRPRPAVPGHPGRRRPPPAGGAPP